MPPPPPTEGAQARARLLHAALRLFAENGFAKASIRDIAQAAGVIADPLYLPVCPYTVPFYAQPHEAFSGRCYRRDIVSHINRPF